MNTSCGRLIHRLGLVVGLAILGSASGCCAVGGWVMNNSGVGYYQHGNYVMARHEFAHAVAMAPWNSDYRHNLAMSLARMGDTQRAEQILHHNLTLDAMHQPTYHSLAKLMIDSGRQSEAEQILTTWAGSQPYNAQAHLELAWMQRETGNIPAAEMALQQALQVEPQNPVALAQLGQLYQDSGDPARAANLYQQSLAVKYGQPEVQARLAGLQSTYGNPAMSPGMMPQMPAMSVGSPSSETMLASYRRPQPNPMLGMFAPQTFASTPNVMVAAPQMSPTPMMTTAPMMAGAPMMTTAPMMASMPMGEIQPVSASMPAMSSPTPMATTQWSPSPVAHQTAWRPVGMAHQFDRSIPAGTVQVTPWQWADAATPPATAAQASPTPMMVQNPQLQPVPDPQLAARQQVRQSVPATQPSPSFEVPQLPGVIEQPATAITIRPATTPTAVQPVTHWQASPAAVPQGVEVQQVSPAQFQELSGDLPTIEPY